MKQYYVVHYAELGLKRGNRKYFEERLCRNIQFALTGTGVAGRVRRISGRLLVEVEEGAHDELIRERLGRCFGVAFFGSVRECPTDLDGLAAESLRLVRGSPASSFAIDTRRSDKGFPFTSVEVNRHVGAAIQQATGLPVRLAKPDMTVWIEIVNDRAFVYAERTPGPGGLPANISGKIAVLLSGGIDSPVAAWKMMKRGCTAVFVHFHSFPYTNRESQDKARRLAEILAGYQHRARLYLVPFAGVQNLILTGAPAALRVILYRRYMLRLAESIARRERARLLVTGDSLGQVASQTVQNIDVISRAVSMPILRPLAGDDKLDIVRIAKAIGTFETSTLPDQDCCSLFVPRHPETHARLKEVEAAEAGLDVAEAMKDALARSEVLLQSAPYVARAVHQL